MSQILEEVRWRPHIGGELYHVMFGSSSVRFGLCQVMFGLCSVMCSVSVRLCSGHVRFMFGYARFMFGYVRFLFRSCSVHVRDLGNELSHIGFDEILRTARVGADDLPHDAKHT